MPAEQNRTDIDVLMRDVARHDTTIDKLTEVSSKIAQLLAVQGTRLDQQDERFRSTDTRNDRDLDRLKQDFEHELAELEDVNKDNSKRISAIEKRMWIAMGAIFFVAFVVKEFGGLILK